MNCDGRAIRFFYVFVCPIAIDDFEQNQFEEIAPATFHFFAAQNLRQCVQNGHYDVGLPWIEQRKQHFHDRSVDERESRLVYILMF